MFALPLGILIEFSVNNSFIEKHSLQKLIDMNLDVAELRLLLAASKSTRVRGKIRKIIDAGASTKTD